MQSQSPKLLEQVRNTIRLKHYSDRTEQSYIQWIKRFILFHNKRHPREMGREEVDISDTPRRSGACRCLNSKCRVQRHPVSLQQRAPNSPGVWD
jgi:Phage integrase, N-terminal SAM-like domain